MKALVLLLMLSALASCSDPTAPGAALVGRWATPARSLGSEYSRSERLNFQADGLLEHEVRVFRSGRLEQTQRSTYVFTLRDDSLFTSGVVWLTDALASMTPFNRGRIVLNGATLTITYPWFGPADEPITVTTTFFREACLRMVLNRCL